jgi:hypothetical protein
LTKEDAFTAAQDCRAIPKPDTFVRNSYTADNRKLMPGISILSIVVAVIVPITENP